MPSTLLAGLGFNKFRPGSSQNVERWLQDSIPDETAIVTLPHRVPLVSTEFQQIQRSERRDSGHVSETSDRGGKGYHTRLLQSHVCGTQEKWEVETDHRPVTTKQANRHTPLQDGDTGFRTFSGHEGPVDDVNRPVRCILSYPHTSHKQKISTLRIQGDSIPVQSPLLRSKHSAHDLHPGDETNRVHGAQRGHQTASIHRRLAVCGTQPRRICPSHTETITNSSNARPEGERREIRATTKHLFYVSRDGNRLDQVQSIPDTETYRKSSTADVALSVTGLSTCMEMAAATRPSCIAREASQERQKKTTSPTISIEGELEASSDQESLHMHNTGVSPSGSMVVPKKKTRRGNIIGTIHFRLPDVYGRIQGRMGSVSKRTAEIRTMDKGRISTPHKSIGDEGSIQGIESLPGVSDRHVHISNDRQHDCSILPEQAGGDTFQEPVHEHHSSPRLGRKTKDDHNIKICTRLPKRQGRRSKQEKSDSETRMVTTTTSIHSDLQDVGDSTCGFIRNQSKPQASTLLLSNTRPTSTRGRCHDKQLERDVSLRLSTNTANKSDIEQASSGRSRSHSNSSSMAESRMVSRPQVSNSGSTITTTRLLTYHLVNKNLVWRVTCKDDIFVIDILYVKDEVDGNFVPTLEQLQGITFYTNHPEKTIIHLDGNKIAKIQINQPDEKGKTSISIPRTYLEFPDIGGKSRDY